MATAKQKQKQKQRHGGKQKSSSFLEQLLTKVNAQAAERIRQFCNFDAESSTQTLARMWESGRRVDELKKPIYSKPAEPGSTAVNVIKVLAEAVQKHESLLAQGWQLYRAFPTEQLRREMLETKLANGRPVGWHHWRHLLVMHSPEGSNAAFNRMLHETIVHNWSPDELGQRIATQRALAGALPHAGGRPVGIPSGVRGRLGKLLSQSDALIKNATAIYVSPQYGFLAAVRGMSQHDVASQATELTTEVATARDKLRAIHDLINDQLFVELDRTIQHIRQCEASQPGTNGKAPKAKSEADKIEDDDLEAT